MGHTSATVLYAAVSCPVFDLIFLLFQVARGGRLSKEEHEDGDIKSNTQLTCLLFV